MGFWGSAWEGIKNNPVTNFIAQSTGATAVEAAIQGKNPLGEVVDPYGLGIRDKVGLNDAPAADPQATADTEALRGLRGKFLEEYDQNQPRSVERPGVTLADPHLAQSSQMGQAQSYNAAQTGNAPQVHAPTLGPAAQATAQNATAARINPVERMIASEGAHTELAGAVDAQGVTLDPITRARVTGIQGTQLNTREADGARTLQQEAAGSARDAMMGKAPSVAEMQIRGQLNRAVNTQQAAAAGARGMARAGATQQFMQNAARLEGDALAAGGLARAQEVATARGQLGQFGGEIRGQDLSQATTDAQLGQRTQEFNAGATNTAGLADAAAGNQRNLVGGQMQADTNRFNAGQTNTRNLTQGQMTQAMINANADRAQGANAFNAGAENTRGIQQANLDTSVNVGNADRGTAVSQFNTGQTNDMTKTQGQMTLAANTGNADRTNQNNQFNVGQTNDALQFGANANNVRTQAQAAQDTNTSQFNAGQMTNTSQFNAGQTNDMATGTANRALQGTVADDNRRAQLRGDVLQAGTATSNAQLGVGTNAAQEQERRDKALGQGIGAAAQIFGSDEKMKKDVQPVGHDKMAAFLDSINPKEFEYKDDVPPELGADGRRHTGFLAGDVDNTPVGQSFIKQTPAGKVVDTDQATGAMMAALAYMHDRMKRLEGARRGVVGNA